MCEMVDEREIEFQNKRRTHISAKRTTEWREREGGATGKMRNGMKFTKKLGLYNNNNRRECDASANERTRIYVSCRETIFAPPISNYLYKCVNRKKLSKTKFKTMMASILMRAVFKRKIFISTTTLGSLRMAHIFCKIQKCCKAVLTAHPLFLR